MRNPAVPAVRLSGDAPKYGERALRARVEGIVLVEALIERDGRVTAVRVLKPLPFGLEEAAREAVLTWKYKPALQNGTPVRAIQRVSVSFELP